VKEPVIVDSACLISLERISFLDLLSALFDPIIAPPEVQREFGKPLSWIRIETPTNQTFVAALKLLVDFGEAEAMALAYELGHLIILDDHQARPVAKNLGLRICGTVGTLVKAKQEGVITAINPFISAPESNGFYMSKSLKEVLRLAGE
jgi:predicted nucleic acid-binding protein